MLLSQQTVKINKLAKEILLAQSYLVLACKNITFYSIANRINEVRKNKGNDSEVSQRTVKQYIKSNLKIKELENE